MLKIVSQVGLCAIGFDAAFLGCDIDARPSGSRVDWTQRRGRHKRAFPAVAGNRDYQAELIVRARESIRLGRKPLIVMGCGAGKSHLACMMAQSAHAKGKAIGFLTVRRALVKDLSARLDRFGVPHGVVMDGHTDNHHRTKVASIHTVASRELLLDVDLLFLDEAHLYLSDGFRAVVDRHAHIPRIGLTATPGRADGQPLLLLANELLLGPSTQTLIERGFLVPTRVFVAGNPNLTGVAMSGSDLNERQVAEVMNRRELNGNIVKEWMRLGEGRPTIVHAVNIAHSKAIVERFVEAGIEAVHIDASTPDCERESVFAWMGARAPEKKDAILIDVAGNVLRFGHPDDDSGWSLESDGSPTLQPSEKALSIRNCPECLFVFRSTLPECPNCGEPYVSTQKQIIEREVELKEIERGRKAAALAGYAARSRDEEKIAKLAEYLRTARARMYKQGWAFGRYNAVFLEKAPAHIVREAYRRI